MDNKQTWAKEPWRRSYGAEIRAIYAADGRQVTFSQGTMNMPLHQNMADYDRIVACVNACAGVPMEVLKQTSYLQLVGEFNVRSNAVTDAVNTLARIHDDPKVPVLRLNNSGSIEEEWFLFSWDDDKED